MIYSYIYKFAFPKFDSSNKLVKLAIFFCAQLAFWAIVFIFLWFGVRKRVKAPPEIFRERTLESDAPIVSSSDRKWPVRPRTSHSRGFSR